MDFTQARIRFLIVLPFILGIISCQTILDKHKELEIEWGENMEGDFSFKNKWSYPEGIYRNKFGQLSCDGICPTEIDNMKDESGKIYKDSLAAFYRIIDTTHMYHSIQSQCKMYEYSGTNFIKFVQKEDGFITGQSLNNVSTHSSLVIELENDICKAFVNFNSITDLGRNRFPLENGNITIDSTLLKKGIIKAEFDFKFRNALELNKDLFWKGKIYSKIIKE